MNLWDEDRPAADAAFIPMAWEGVLGSLWVTGLAFLCSISSNDRMVVSRERSELVAGTGVLGKAGDLALPSTSASSAHRYVCGCDPVAVDGSPGPWGRCWVTSSESKEDLKTQSAHFTEGQNEATGATPVLVRHTWIEVIVFLPLLPACGAVASR